LGFEIDFLPVGDSNADAILAWYSNPIGGYTIHLTDGGYTETAERILGHIKKYYGNAPIDHVILSHADDDHAGLVEVPKNHTVYNLWMNMPWIYTSEVIDKFHGSYTVQGLINKIREIHPYLVELEKIAKERGIPVRSAFQGSQIGAFTVLAPSRETYVGLIPDLDRTPTSYAEQAAKTIGGILSEAIKAVVNWVTETWQGETLGDDLGTSASNQTSLVQWASIDGQAILLTADVDPKGLAEAAFFASKLGILFPPQFVQVPHHGSRHNISKTTLNLWLGEPLADNSIKRGVAFCSAGDGDNAGKSPRKVVSNAFLRRGYPVHSTNGADRQCRRVAHPAAMWGRDGRSSRPRGATPGARNALA
jgi:beta-lactamase superfamily II metal-dependent hydrolase